MCLMTNNKLTISNIKKDYAIIWENKFDCLEYCCVKEKTCLYSIQVIFHFWKLPHFLVLFSMSLHNYIFGFIFLVLAHISRILALSSIFKQLAWHMTTLVVHTTCVFSRFPDSALQSSTWTTSGQVLVKVKFK